MNKPKISVVINTYNAEKHLEKVFQSVRDFDEILVCDMHSNDATIEIAEQHGCRVIFHRKESVVEPARNFAIQSATHDWVLIVDADEIVSNELRAWLYAHTLKDKTAEGVKIPRKNYFMGKMMRAAYPDYCLRFFKKADVYWEPVIHAQPTVDGQVLEIDKRKKELAFEHLAHDSVADILHKTDVYTDQEVPKRLHKKITLLTLLFSPLSWFFKFYFLKKGWMDGKEGFIFSALKAHYKFASLAKVYEYKRHHT